MRAVRALIARLASAVQFGRRDLEIQDELASHLQLHIDDNIRAGMTPDEARRDAVITLGGLTQTQERCRERVRPPFFDVIKQDVIYAVRTFRRNPGFAATAILTLALGIGSTSAIFSAINAVLLRPLPFADPARLVMVYGVARSARGVDMHDSVSYPNFADWRDRAATLESAGAYANRALTVTTAPGESRVLRGKQVTPSLFGVLGVRPALGRAFRPDEDQPALSRVVILSHGFWRQQLGGDPHVLGRTLQINDTPFVIVGVMAPDFHIDVAESEQLYAPLPVDATRNHEFLRVIARLQRDTSARQAQADLDEVCRRLARTYPRTNEGVAANVEPLVDAIAGPGRLALLILFAVVTVVLLIACTNVASLLLARGATRQREMAVRAALGAGRGRLVRQLLVESLLLAVAGGIAGLFVAEWLARGLVAIVSDVAPVPRLDTTRTDMWVVAFTTLVSMTTGIVFGVAPCARLRVDGSERSAARRRPVVDGCPCAAPSAWPRRHGDSARSRVAGRRGRSDENPSHHARHTPWVQHREPARRGSLHAAHSIERPREPRAVLRRGARARSSAAGRPRRSVRRRPAAQRRQRFRELPHPGSARPCAQSLVQRRLQHRELTLFSDDGDPDPRGAGLRGLRHDGRAWRDRDQPNRRETLLAGSFRDRPADRSSHHSGEERASHGGRRR
jgi:hypothetical protein